MPTLACISGWLCLDITHFGWLMLRHLDRRIWQVIIDYCCGRDEALEHICLLLADNLQVAFCFRFASAVFVLSLEKYMLRGYQQWLIALSTAVVLFHWRLWLFQPGLERIRYDVSILLVSQLLLF